MFELIWEEQSLHILVDSEPIATEGSTGQSANDEVCLFSSGGNGYGVWAGIELFYTPIGQATWASGVQSPSEGCFTPWQAEPLVEKGYWQDLGDYVIPHGSVGQFCKLVDTWKQMEAAFAAFAAASGDPTVTIHPVMRQMLGSLHEVIEERPDGTVGLLCPDGFLRFFPHAVCVLPDPSEEESAMQSRIADEKALSVQPHNTTESTVETVRELAAAPPPPTYIEQVTVPQDQVPVQAARGVVLDCWSTLGETELEQIERVVAHFVQMMHDQGVALPDNIRMVSQCKEAAHRRCFVYRFGTRRLHFAARAMDDGRLLLVVRCGGGFMDFVEFARRHGGLEQIKLRKQLEASGVVRVNRVLQSGSIKVTSE